MRKSALIGALMAAAAAGVGMPGIAMRAGGSRFRGHAVRKSVALAGSRSRGWGRCLGHNPQTNESARRRSQIDRGQLTASNGLVLGVNSGA